MRPAGCAVRRFVSGVPPADNFEVGRGGRFEHALLGALAAALGAAATGAGLGFVAPVLGNALVGAGGTVAGVAAGAGFVVRARADAVRRFGWLAVGVFAVAGTAWSTVAAVQVAVPGRAPVLAAHPNGDLGALVAAPFGVLGLLVLTRRDGNRQSRLLAGLDAAIAACALATLAYGVGRPAGVGAVGTLHAIAAVLLGTAAIAAIARCRLEGDIPFLALFLIGAGVIVCELGDLFSLRPLALGEWSPRHPSYLLAVAGRLVLGLAVLSRTAERADLVQLRRREYIAVLTPVLPVLAVGSLLIAAAVMRVSLRPATLILLGVLGILLLLAWLAARLDQLLLSRTLEHRVVERTLALRTHAKWFRSLVQNSSDIITIVDPSGVIRYQTPSATRVLGYDPNAMVGQRFVSLVAPADVHRLEAILLDAVLRPRSTHTIEFAMRHAAGHWRETETVITSLVDDHDIRGLVLNTRDVSERKELERQLTRQAFSDPLTGLANRALFANRVEHALSERSRQPGEVAVLFLDLDGFKGVNDAQGHAVGDHLLTLVADRLRRCVRPSDTVARLGGDEFAILVVGPQAEAHGVDVAERVQRALAEPFLLSGREVTLAASIGIAVTDDGTETVDQLLRNADLAMYRAKSSRKGTYVRFRTEMHDALLARVQTETDLRHALSRRELVLHYQPTVNLRTGQVVGVEALIRWYHPTRGLIQPMDFIGMAEETGLVESIGAWAIRECCRQGARWQRYAQPGGVFHVAVNVSGRQLHPRLPDIVRTALTETGMPPGALVIEVTENILVKRSEEAIAVLRQLKSFGVRVAIDDFGTGYSSLSYLARFPVDVLKIDKSFVEQITDRNSGTEGTELVRTILHLGRALRLGTVAEGIETREQYAALLAMSCDYGQGYLFSRPLPAEGIDTLFGGTLVAGLPEQRVVYDATTHLSA